MTLYLIDHCLPIWLSISKIFSMLLGSIKVEVNLFSTANTTPCDVQIPTAVEPSWGGKEEELKLMTSTILGFYRSTFIASIAYST